VLARELWDEMMTLQGDAGARQVLDPRPELVDVVPSLDRLDDIDTPDDYAKIVKLFPRSKPTPKT
jgi:CTP:molybdopterin cytidylyltransferase MocA